MMGHANPEVQGGEQFSVNLTQSLGYALDGAVEDAPELTSWRLESLIDASARNEDANHAILTGSGDYEHPIHGLEPKQTLRGLYTYDWDDDGAAASGLTDWIWERHDSSQAEQEEALNALIGLVNTLGGEESEGFLNIETSADGDDIPPTAAQLNPELAESWTKIFSMYVDHFATSEGRNTNEVFEGDRHTPMFDEGDPIASMRHGDKKDFIQLLVSEESSEPHVLFSVIDYEHRNLEGAIFDQDMSPQHYASEAGLLRGMINGAMMQEYESRNESAADVAEQAQLEAAAKWEATYSIGKDLLGKGLSSIPVAGSTLSDGVGLATTIFDNDARDFIEDKVEDEVGRNLASLDNGEELFNNGEFREDEAQWNIELQIAHMLMEKGVLSEEDLDDDLFVEGENGEPTLPMSQREWETGSSSRAESVRMAAEEALSDQDSASPMNEILEEYVESYVRSFDPLN